jgi:hypothetical protein
MINEWWMKLNNIFAYSYQNLKLSNTINCINNRKIKLSLKIKKLKLSTIKNRNTIKWGINGAINPNFKIEY